MQRYGATGAFVSTIPLKVVGGVQAIRSLPKLLRSAPKLAKGAGVRGLKGLNQSSRITELVMPKNPIKTSRIVLGENMERVRAAAKRIGAETFEGTGMEENRAWLQLKRSQGYEIYDIGPDFARRSKRVEQGIRPDSPFYNMERMETKNCNNYHKLFERTGKYQGGSPGIDY